MRTVRSISNESFRLRRELARGPGSLRSSLGLPTPVGQRAHGPQAVENLRICNRRLQHWQRLQQTTGVVRRQCRAGADRFPGVA